MACQEQGSTSQLRQEANWFKTIKYFQLEWDLKVLRQEQAIFSNLKAKSSVYLCMTITLHLEWEVGNQVNLMLAKNKNMIYNLHAIKYILKSNICIPDKADGY